MSIFGSTYSKRIVASVKMKIKIKIQIKIKIYKNECKNKNKTEQNRTEQNRTKKSFSFTWKFLNEQILYNWIIIKKKRLLKKRTHFNYIGSLFKKQTFNIKRKLYKNICDNKSSDSNNNYFQMLSLKFDKIICNDTLKTV